MLVRLQGPVTAFGLDGPDFDRLVVGGREQQEAARVEHQTPHPVIVTDQRHQAEARAGVPQLAVTGRQAVSDHTATARPNVRAQSAGQGTRRNRSVAARKTNTTHSQRTGVKMNTNKRLNGPVAITESSHN